MDRLADATSRYRILLAPCGIAPCDQAPDNHRRPARRQDFTASTAVKLRVRFDGVCFMTLPARCADHADSRPRPPLQKRMCRLRDGHEQQRNNEQRKGGFQRRSGGQATAPVTH